jgi:quercetin dioxygenase-like cupin family protein
VAGATRFHERDVDWVGDLGEGVMARSGGRSRRKLIGDPAQGLFVNLSEYDPNVTLEAHSHDAPELMYILEGEMTIGGERCLPGTVLRVPAHTVYGPLSAGPEGVRFLVVRSGPARTTVAE